MLFRHVNGRKRSLGLGFCCIAGVVRSSSASNLEALLEAAESSPDRERISHLLKLCGHFKALPQAQRLHRLISSSDGDGRLDDGDYFFADAKRWSQARPLHARHDLKSLPGSRRFGAGDWDPQEDRENVVVGNALVGMYSRCGSPELAKRVFDRLVYRDLATWNGILSAFSQEQDGSSDTFQIFRTMLQEGTAPNRQSFVTILEACSSSRDLSRGREIRVGLQGCGLDSNSFVATALINFYSRCGDLDEARRVFSGVCKQDVVLWTSMASENYNTTKVASTEECS
ncbi:pentatricopeptide repeat-containing protein DOT4, chloroplastic [Selaginella moellendorffii]|uniref:pentatricopeptide repeat-containing protein DOT4, chloroplastic n=1 Tax=Selaginella moellendorffii TaxID=88036 RepID=UPI000D1C6B91|nr:pentatricopeptide repeat-containing protein DOT4, chloroplastic [Selaginella moellendorffii]|eukprot:XP_024518481.1 pentatricopeptide repeat-containing protein DOT4, chloroplastic [Selaginella moellendorffii]